MYLTKWTQRWLTQKRQNYIKWLASAFLWIVFIRREQTHVGLILYPPHEISTLQSTDQFINQIYTFFLKDVSFLSFFYSKMTKPLVSSFQMWLFLFSCLWFMLLPLFCCCCFFIVVDKTFSLDSGNSWWVFPTIFDVLYNPHSRPDN